MSVPRVRIAIQGYDRYQYHGLSICIIISRYNHREASRLQSSYRVRRIPLSRVGNVVHAGLQQRPVLRVRGYPSDFKV